MKNIFYIIGFVALVIMFICFGMMDSDSIGYIAIAIIGSALLATMSINTAIYLEREEENE